MKNIHMNNPLLDYLYVNASTDYISAGGPPDPKIRSKWISNHIQDDIDYIDKQMLSIQEDILANPRLNELVY